MMRPSGIGFWLRLLIAAALGVGIVLVPSDSTAFLVISTALVLGGAVEAARTPREWRSRLLTVLAILLVFTAIRLDWFATRPYLSTLPLVLLFVAHLARRVERRGGATA